MSDKTSFKLTIGERLQLLNVIPAQGNITTIKILRKLRETLSPNEQEYEEYGFVHEWVCMHRETDGRGRPKTCNLKLTEATQPRCPEHDKAMAQTGLVFWDEEKSAQEKEIFLGNTAKGIIVAALKNLSDEQQLPVEQEGLYEKFVTAAAAAEED